MQENASLKGLQSEEGALVMMVMVMEWSGSFVDDGDGEDDGSGRGYECEQI